jgi:hypothetical protein
LSLIIGLYAGFKIANSQHRMALDKDLQAIDRRCGGRRRWRRRPERRYRADASVIDKARSNPDDIEAAARRALTSSMQISRPAEALPFLQQASAGRRQGPAGAGRLGDGQLSER